MTEELIKKAKEAKSTEELIEIAKDNGITLTLEEAEEHFLSLHKSGEIEDDELDSVSGGACHTNYNGKKYTVVTSACKCFTGMYEGTPYKIFDDVVYADWYHYSKDGCCGRCRYLWIEKGLGFCSKTAR